MIKVNQVHSSISGTTTLKPPCHARNRDTCKMNELWLLPTLAAIFCHASTIPFTSPVSCSVQLVATIVVNVHDVPQCSDLKMLCICGSYRARMTETTEVDVGVLSKQDTYKKHTHWFGSLQLQVWRLENRAMYMQPSRRLAFRPKQSQSHYNLQVWICKKSCKLRYIILVKRHQSWDSHMLLNFPALWLGVCK